MTGTGLYERAKPEAADANPDKARGDELFRKKKYAEASRAYSAAIVVAPEDPKIYSNRAACCEKLMESMWGAEKIGWLECGLGDARKCVALAPRWAKGHARLAAACGARAAYSAETAWEREDYDEEAAAASMMKRRPDGGVPLFSASARAECDALNRERERACRAGLALDPPQEPSASTLRRVLAALRDDAAYECEKGDAADAPLRRPDAAAPLKASGNEKFAAKDYKGAAANYGAALAEDPMDAVLYSNRAACRSAVHDHAAALRDARRCVALKPTWPKAYARVAAALYGLGRYGDASAAAAEGLATEAEATALASAEGREPAPPNAHLAALSEKCERERAEPLDVQAELHRLREDQRSRGSLTNTLNSLKKTDGQGGTPALFDAQSLLGALQGAPGAPAGLKGLDLSSLDLGGMGGGMKSAAADQPALSEAQIRKLARANCEKKRNAPPPPTRDQIAGAAAAAQAMAAAAGGGSLPYTPDYAAAGN